MRLLLLFFFIALAQASERSPQRVVSMSLCSDQMVLHFLPSKRIAAVSYLAQDPAYSHFYSRTKNIPLHKANVEFILSLKPDLILASRYERSQTTSMLQRLGQPVVIVDEPQSIAAIDAYTLEIARHLDEESFARQSLRVMHERWQTVDEIAAAKNPYLVVSMSANGYQQGQHSLFNELLRRVGWETLADRWHLPFDQNLSIERVIAAQPQVLLYHSGEQGRSQAEIWLQHPAWQAIHGVVDRHQINTADWICVGPWTADVVLDLVTRRKF